MGKAFIPLERATAGEEVFSGHIVIGGNSACGFMVKDQSGNVDVNFNMHPSFYPRASVMFDAIEDVVEKYGASLIISLAPDRMGVKRAFGDMVVSVSVDNLPKAKLILPQLRHSILASIAGKKGEMSKFQQGEAAKASIEATKENT